MSTQVPLSRLRCFLRRPSTQKSLLVRTGEVLYLIRYFLGYPDPLTKGVQSFMSPLSQYQVILSFVTPQLFHRIRPFSWCFIVSVNSLLSTESPRLERILLGHQTYHGPQIDLKGVGPDHRLLLTWRHDTSAARRELPGTSLPRQ